MAAGGASPQFEASVLVHPLLVELTPGRTLGPYQIVEKVGAGGMGSVYRARDTRLERSVAIRVLPEGLADDPRLCEAWGQTFVLLTSEQRRPDPRGYLAQCRRGRWSPLGTDLFYLGTDGNLMRVPMVIGSSLKVGRPVSLFHISSAGMMENHEFGSTHYDVAPDGQYFLVREIAQGSDEAPVIVMAGAAPAQH